MGREATYMEVGDFLMGYTNITSGPITLLENSADYMVTSVGELTKNDFGIMGNLVWQSMD